MSDTSLSPGTSLGSGRTRTWIASLLAVLLVAAGSLAGVTPAFALGTLTAAVTASSPTGLQVAVQGEGVPDGGAYAALIVKGTEADVTGSSGYAAVAYLPAIVGGTFSTTLSAAAGGLDRTEEYEVILWRSQSVPGPDTLYARGDVNVSTEHWDAVFGPVAPEPEPEPETPVVVPTVTVSKTSGLDPAGETVTVRGTGFLPSSPATDGANRPPLQGSFAGAYVVFGSFAEAWQPSAGAASSTRKGIDTKWGVHEAQLAAIGGAARGGIVIAADGTFETTLTIAETEDALEGGRWGVYTYAGGGAVYAPFETSTLITFAEPEPEPVFEPAIEVFLVDGVTPVGAGEVREGDELVVRGTGFDPAANVGGMGQPIPAHLPQGTFVVFGSFADEWQPSAGNPSSSRVMNQAARQWALAESVLDQVPPAFQSTIRGAWAPLDEDGSFTATVTALAPTTPLADGNWGVYTYPAGVNTPANPAQELSVPVNFIGTEPEPEPEPSGPQLDVTVSTVSADAGATVRIVGTEFGTVTGAYAAIIEKGTDASVGMGGGYVTFGYWATPGTITGGAFDKTLTAATAALDRTKQYEVVVWEAHSPINADTLYARADVPFTSRDWNTLFPPDRPSVTVSKTSGLDPEGETITVRGTGFVPAGAETTGTRPPLFGQFTGAYVVFGVFADTWKPSALAPSSARKGYDTKWIVNEAQLAVIGGVEAGGAIVQPDGTFEVTLDAALVADAPDGNWGVYTYAAGGAVYAPFETYTPVSFATGPTEPEEPETPEVPETPTTPVTPAPIAGGSLRWSIQSGFVDYVTGPIAKGTVAVSGGATRSGGLFQFGQAAGSTYDPTTGTGTVSYSGAVRFSGHGGLLTFDLANPELRVTSSTSAQLWVTSGGSRLQLATVDLGAAARTGASGAVTFAGAPVVLTSQGSALFDGRYSRLDPLTVTIGTAAAAPAGATGTVVTAAATTTQRKIPDAPPATTGIELDADTLAALGAGESVTVTAAGFEAGEDVLVVVYSTPTLLATVEADASGAASWTGSLPATLADGAHTLTFQGAEHSVGIEFTLARAAVSGSCLVDGATLAWGYKESFRTYIEGIAGGGWELTDVAYVYPDFTWSGGTGSLDPETVTGVVTFGGSIRFTGHDGALDTTLSNARLELAGDTGYLVFDVAGTTQEGDAVAQQNVRLAEFALPAAGLGEDGLVLDAVPATLTDAGAAAFGTYAAGESLDPVSAVIPLDAACGVAAVESEAESTGGQDEPVAAAPISADVEDAPVWPWIAGGALLALLIVGAAWIVIARRRAAGQGAAGAGAADAEAAVGAGENPGGGH